MIEWVQATEWWFDISLRWRGENENNPARTKNSGCRDYPAARRGGRWTQQSQTSECLCFEQHCALVQDGRIVVTKQKIEIEMIIWRAIWWLVVVEWLLFVCCATNNHNTGRQSLDVNSMWPTSCDVISLMGRDAGRRALFVCIFYRKFEINVNNRQCIVEGTLMLVNVTKIIFASRRTPVIDSDELSVNFKNEISIRISALLLDIFVSWVALRRTKLSTINTFNRMIEVIMTERSNQLIYWF